MDRLSHGGLYSQVISCIASATVLSPKFRPAEKRSLAKLGKLRQLWGLSGLRAMDLLIGRSCMQNRRTLKYVKFAIHMHSQYLFAMSCLQSKSAFAPSITGIAKDLDIASRSITNESRRESIEYRPNEHSLRCNLVQWENSLRLERLEWGSNSP